MTKDEQRKLTAEAAAILERLAEAVERAGGEATNPDAAMRLGWKLSRACRALSLVKHIDCDPKV